MPHSYLSDEETCDFHLALERLHEASSRLLDERSRTVYDEAGRARVGALVDEARQALTIIVLVAGPLASLERARATPVSVSCCLEPKVRGGRCDNCGVWIDDWRDEGAADRARDPRF